MMVTRDELRERYGRSQPFVAPPETQDESRERAFVVDGRDRTVISTPIREIASKNEGFTYLRGRFVEADNPNRNGAYWTTDDLQMGEATVAGGPLNWLHDDMKIVGALLDGRLISGREAAAEGVNNHIVSNAAMWRFLFPKEVQAVERAAASGQLWYSMECVSKSVVCSGDNGCQEEFDYAATLRGEACSHLREKSSVRRFKDPIFLGGALILPPVEPGWAKADVEVVRQAAQVTEEQHLSDRLEKKDAERMVASILTWANRREA